MRQLAVVLFLPLIGCSGIAEADSVRVPGTIQGYDHDDPRVTISQQGREVSVTVTTYGDGCLEKGETEVQVEGARATVAPFDYVPRPGTHCPRILRRFEHAVTLVFTEGDTGMVVVRGLSRGMGPDAAAVEVEFEFIVPLD
jgi:hypothetical protein